MPSTARAAEASAYENVRANPFTRIHGRPTRGDYEIIKHEAATLASKVEDITYAWSRDPVTGDEYGLLAKILGLDEYDHQTGIDTYVEETKPSTYDPAITVATPTHTRKRLEEEWERVRTCWYIRKGFLKGVTANLRDALGEQFYAQLKHRHSAYRNITPFQILEHLNTIWCPLDVQAKKKLKDAYFAKWDGNEHLTAFGKRLDDDQNTLIRSDITISDEDKLQFYLEQIYDSNLFDKAEMMDWESKPALIKTDYAQAKSHFEALVKAHDTYVQNSGGGTAGRHAYESSNSMADLGDEIKEYIAKLASTSITNNDALANIRDTVRTKNSQIEAMAAQLKLLSDTVALLAKNVKPSDENRDPNSRGRSRGARGGQSQQMTKPRNMGAYCWTHGFNPVGVTHDSKTCEFKKEGHRNDATYSNRYEGNTYWPVAMRVAVDQQNHAAWKDKSKPT